MKKVYLLALAAFFGTASMAQVSVTFQVDMNNETVSPNGVHVAGSWQEEAGFSADWQPGESMMADDDQDGIYTLTVSIPAGQYQYKYINGNDWGPDETQIPAVVATGGNRFFAVSDWHGNTDNLPEGFLLPAVPFNGAAPAGQTAVRLVVSMANETVDPSGVHVAGDIITPNWTPEYGTCSETGPDEYSYVTYVDGPGTYQYKFINGDNWGLPNESVPDDCGVDGNRVIEVGEDDLASPSYCYGQCEPCSEPNVTLTVDLSNEDVDNGGYIAGDFNGWSGAPMMDNGDGTYTIMLSLAEGTYQYKFQNGQGGWESVPGECAVGGNRELVVGADPVTVTRCINQCSEECVADPDPANITFRVNMNAETVSPDGVFVIGGFTDPVWQGGALAMDDSDQDGIYEVTYEVSGAADIQFKFVNGDVNVVENEESGDFAAGGCGVDNGIGGFNRTHTRSGVEEVLEAFVFNSCSTVLSVEEAELGRVAIYPNPSNGVSFIEIENPNNHTLRMHIVDITGKVVSENAVINTTRHEIKTNGLNAGLYFLNIVNELNERAVYKLMVK